MKISQLIISFYKVLTSEFDVVKKPIYENSKDKTRFSLASFVAEYTNNKLDPLYDPDHTNLLSHKCLNYFVLMNLLVIVCLNVLIPLILASTLVESIEEH
jgi:hypothetical protein